jgi:hypothetical protein
VRSALDDIPGVGPQAAGGAAPGLRQHQGYPPGRRGRSGGGGAQGHGRRGLSPLPSGGRRGAGIGKIGHTFARFFLRHFAGTPSQISVPPMDRQGDMWQKITVFAPMHGALKKFGPISCDRGQGS